jgi:large subunit ribosomal protein L23
MAKNILKKPVISEKSERLTAKNNVYTFVVDRKANKIEIKNAVEAMFTTNVVDVNTVNMPVKVKTRNTRSGVLKGTKSAFKKAYVKIADGEELDIYGSTEE